MTPDIFLTQVQVLVAVPVSASRSEFPWSQDELHLPHLSVPILSPEPGLQQRLRHD